MFPLDQCYSCIHNQVCGLVETYQKIEQEHPIDLTDSLCNHYQENTIQDFLEDSIADAFGLEPSTMFDDIEEDVLGEFSSFLGKQKVIKEDGETLLDLLISTIEIMNEKHHILFVEMNPATYEEVFEMEPNTFNVLCYEGETIEISVNEDVPYREWDFKCRGWENE